MVATAVSRGVGTQSRGNFPPGASVEKSLGATASVTKNIQFVTILLFYAIKNSYFVPVSQRVAIVN